MEIALILSREHQTLPKAELKGILEAEDIPFKIKNYFNGFLLLEIPEKCLDQFNSVEKRLSLTHEIFRVIIDTDKDDLVSAINKYRWKDLIDTDYAVRVKKMEKSQDINTLELERDIGGIIKDQIGDKVRVNLENPSAFIRTVILDERVFMGPRIFKVPKKHFFDLKPHKRPFFYPGSMSPKLARCMVNLTRIRKGEKLLDPFCGTGGILIEAGIIGARLVGTDIDPKMVAGTIENLQHCNINDYEVFRADVRKLNLPYKVDAVVTDPPYGISASTCGEESRELCGEALLSLELLIKDSGRICMATPHYMDIQGLVDGTKFEIIEQHHIRMHKSLTRVISVLKKS
jgi:tRNA (guanine10-N2)-dimethyltransferase